MISLMTLYAVEYVLNLKLVPYKCVLKFPQTCDICLKIIKTEKYLF